MKKIAWMSVAMEARSKGWTTETYAAAKKIFTYEGFRLVATKLDKVKWKLIQTHRKKFSDSFIGTEDEVKFMLLEMLTILRYADYEG